MPCPSCSTLFLVLALTAVRAWAADYPTAQLRYTREPGAELCPEETQIRSAVSGRLGYDPFASDALSVVIAKVSPSTEGLTAHIDLLDKDQTKVGERTLVSKSRDCTELASAMELAISIAVDPMRALRAPAAAPVAVAPPQPPLPPSPAIAEIDEEEPSSFVPQMLLGVVGVAGSGPSPGAGFLFGVGGRGERLSITLEGQLDLPTSMPVFTGRVAASRMIGTLAPCLHQAWFGACVLLSGGVLNGYGEGLPDSRSASFPFAGAGTRALVDFAVTSNFSLRTHLDLLAPFTRSVILVGDVPVWTGPSLGGSLGLAAVGHLPL